MRVNHRYFATVLIVLWLGSGLYAQADTKAQPAISIDRMRADVKYLSSDRLQGRGVGTRGEELATDYIAEAFQKAGLKPMGDNGTYFQKVPLVLVKTKPEATLECVKDGASTSLKLDDEFVGTSYTQQSEDFEGDAIFVGHGITAPEYGWDDYQGIDVKGKVVVLFTNEPPSEDVAFFNGKSLTYYGRWTYKYEEATRRGAKAVFIIHTPESAGYPYSVVRTVKGAQLLRDPKDHALAFAGWLSSGAGEKLLAKAGLTVADALKQADTRGFKAIPLGFKLKGHIPTGVQKIISKNVIGAVEGSDPTLKSEAVLFSAHWDHLGVKQSSVGVEEIFSGAQDNATGCAILMETARAWSALSSKPKRSAIFLATTAEESGLLGAVHFAAQPSIPLGKIAMNFNFDMVSPIGVPESIVLNGSERTTAWKMLQDTAARHELAIEPDHRAHLGTFYRSDHFALARGGVPAFSVARGERVKGQPADFTKKLIADFIANTYHTPNDKFKEEWDFAGYPTLIRFALDAAQQVANDPTLPTWKAGDEFKPARERSGVK
jgi:Zn-dependent M28 family amino/carboxypeptidase